MGPSPSTRSSVAPKHGNCASVLQNVPPFVFLFDMETKEKFLKAGLDSCQGRQPIAERKMEQLKRQIHSKLLHK